MLLLLCSLLSAYAAVAAPLQRNADPCQQLASQNTDRFKPSEVAACLQSIPFSEENRQSIMDLADTMNMLNVFKVNQKYSFSSDSVLRQGVDLQAEFGRIRNATYSSDWEFQQDLSRAFSALRDSHYGWISCYGGTMFSDTRPISLVSSVDANTNETTIYVAPNLSELWDAEDVARQWSERYGNNYTELEGARVIQIDGQSPMDNLLEVADNVPLTMDRNVALNVLFAGPYVSNGQYGMGRGLFRGYKRKQDRSPDVSTLEIETAAGVVKTITIPWVSKYFPGVFNSTSGADLFDRHCVVHPAVTDVSISSSASATPSATSSSAAATATPTVSSLDDDAKQQYELCPIDPAEPHPLKHDPNNSTAYLGGRDVLFYHLPEYKAGVIVAPTFSPKGICAKRMTLDMILGFRNLTARGVENVIWDPSSNSGGARDLGLMMSRLFAGKALEKELGFGAPYRETNLTIALAQMERAQNKSAFFSAASWRSGDSSTTWSIDQDILNPGLHLNISGHDVHLSEPLFDPIDFLKSYPGELPDNAPFKKIVVAGNGVCGSTCSTTANFLTYYLNATTFVQTAKPNEDIQYQSFAGGTLMTSDNLYQIQSILNVSTSIIPAQPKVQGHFSVAVRGTIKPDTNEFWQYVNKPADRRFAPTAEMYQDPMAMWSYIAKESFGQ